MTIAASEKIVTGGRALHQRLAPICHRHWAPSTLGYLTSASCFGNDLIPTPNSKMKRVTQFDWQHTHGSDILANRQSKLPQRHQSCPLG